MNNYIQSFIPKIIEFQRKNPKICVFVTFFIIYWFYKKFVDYFKIPKSFKNRVILITGGVSGIGRLTALLCKLRGSIVIVWDINDNGLNEMKELIDLSMKVDVTNKNDVDLAAKKNIK